LSDSDPSHVRTGAFKDVAAALNDISSKLLHVSLRAESRSPRSDDIVAISRLLKRASHETARLCNACPTAADLAAWSARNLFELFVVFQTIVKSPEMMKRWISQTMADEIQVLEASRPWNNSAARQSKLDDALLDLHQRCARLGLDAKAREFNIKVLAGNLGLKDEYEMLFKFSSKFVHPSAALVNGRLESDDVFYTNLFAARIQVIALILHSEAETWLTSWAKQTAH
jgi:hypothetical protein